METYQIMNSENKECVQLINTAIIKTKENNIDKSYEDRLQEICQSPVIAALNKSIEFLSESQRISADQAAIQIVETIRELDSIWNDYIVMEGLEKLKDFLKNTKH